jgi:ribonuclease J
MSKKSGDELLFVPLGGVGEIGMNLYLYGHKGKWLIVDCGISFGDAATPGIDILMPDPSFIENRRDDLVGIVLTHGHEDHLGAIPYLWDRLRCPVYATSFTADLLKAKLIDAAFDDLVPIHVKSPGERFKLGPFDLEYVAMTHSIPEPNLLVIRTKAGLVAHTGDWKLDPNPLICKTADEERLAEIGSEGVLALICDSTNVFTEGASGSEAEVRESLIHLIGHYPKRIAVTCFATNVARLESIAKAAKAHGRAVALVGRSLWRIDEVARKNGYLRHTPPFLTDREALDLPEEKVLFICTGSQGESRSALARIAKGDHPSLELDTGDVVIFSSRVIPGNEKEIARVQNGLVRQGVEVVTDEDHFVHVSGHPGRAEMRRLYELLKPRIAIPMHGEERHLLAHADFARLLGVHEVVQTRDGGLVRIAPGPAEVVDEVPVGKFAMDGDRLIRLDSPVMKSRHRMIWNGTAVVTLVMDMKGKLLADPLVSAPGLLDAAEDSRILERLGDLAGTAVEKLPNLSRRDDASVKEAARLAVRRALTEKFGKKPVTEIHLVRV